MTSPSEPVVDLLTKVREADARAVWAVADEVFDEHSGYEAWWTAVWDKHTNREGFRLARAHSSDGSGLVGFAYGYTGEPRQWWTDQAAHLLGPALAATWLGGHFEVVTLAVVAAQRGRGIGARLLAELTDEIPHPRRLLMTTRDPDDPARRLYARQGWEVIGPGMTPDQVIMGWCAQP